MNSDELNTLHILELLASGTLVDIDETGEFGNTVEESPLESLSSLKNLYPVTYKFLHLVIYTHLILVKITRWGEVPHIC
ncbi:MAG: hypothetical protein ACI93R_004056 [Flavobacteriales bacterium]|jgi:hypothetical protein